LEYARNVLGFWDAAHEEYDPPAGSRLVLHRLTCTVAGKELPIQLAPDSLAAKTYARTSILERYYCSFGINQKYRYSLGDERRPTKPFRRTRMSKEHHYLTTIKWTGTGELSGQEIPQKPAIKAL
jgi:CTP synthase (UTP-ammonia lyase)